MDNRTLAINRVKGGRSGVQALDRHKGEPLLDEVAAMYEWLRERTEDGSGILFLSQKGGMLSRMQLLRLFGEYAAGGRHSQRPGQPARSAALALHGDGGATRRGLRHSTAGKTQEHLEHDDLHAYHRPSGVRQLPSGANGGLRVR